MGVKKPAYQKWLDRAQYDIETAGAMHTTRRYIYSVFMCQQALEKCFKVVMTFKGIDIVPIHNLRRLSEAINVMDQMTKEDLVKIGFLSQYYLNARYKEDIEELSSQITAEIANDYLIYTKEKIQWLTLKTKL